MASTGRANDIERMGPAGWERVRAVRLAALADTPDAFGMTLAEESRKPPDGWRSRLEDPGSATFLATAGSDDVGLVVGSRYDGAPHAAGLYAMWVHPNHRRYGIAEALISAVIAWARAAGHARVLLDVGDWNVAAIRLYERMGFRPTGVTGFLSPGREHVTEHQRALAL